LGKTATVLEAYRRLREMKRVRNMLVVAPLRVARWTWWMEMEKWDQFRGFTYRDIRRDGYAPGYDIYTINYEALPKLVAEIKRGKRFDMVVLDELTRAKNHKGKRVASFREHLNHASVRVGLTGTPASNSLMDLFGQINALDGATTGGPSRGPGRGYTTRSPTSPWCRPPTSTSTSPTRRWWTSR
jgi:superfamily II DNA or RNA helicase